MEGYLSAKRGLCFRSVYAAALLSVFCSYGTAAQTEIHRCMQPDGTVAFQGQPCKETPPRASDGTEEENDATDTPDAEPRAMRESDNVFVSPYDELAADPAPQQDEAPSSPSEDRERCEKRARDAIDAIDLEIRRESSADQRDQYLPRLRELTAELRACKRL